MNIIDRRPENYYELDVTIDGVTRKYIPLGSYSYWQGIDENLPDDVHNIELWLKLIKNEYETATTLAALTSIYLLYNDKVLDKNDSPLCDYILSNSSFIEFCEKYFRDYIFDHEIFMDNSQDIGDYTYLAKFDFLEDEKTYYKEGNAIFEIVNSQDRHNLNDNAFGDLLMDERYLKDFEKDYRKIVSLFENYIPNKNE